MIRSVKALFRTRVLRGFKNRLWHPWMRARQRRAVRDVREGRATGVLVYQMGKVASKSIAVSLSRYSGIRVFHLHLLNPENYEGARKFLRDLTGKDDSSFVSDLSRIVFDGLVVTGQPLKVISLVREPIARNISAYFQNLDLWWRLRDAHLRIPLERLIERFKDSYTHDEPLRWFEEEFLKTTDIDVYKTPFPFDLGYQQLERGRLGVLIARHDLDDQLKTKLIGELVGVDDFQLIRDNTAEAKPYRDCYKAFLQNVRLDRSYVDQMLDSKYACHFFSPEERERLRRRWLRFEDRAVSPADA